MQNRAGGGLQQRAWGAGCTRRPRLAPNRTDGHRDGSGRWGQAGIPALSIGRENGIHRGRPRGGRGRDRHGVSRSRPGSRHAPLLPAPAATGRTVSMAIENDGLQDTVAPTARASPHLRRAPGWRPLGELGGTAPPVAVPAGPNPVHQHRHHLLSQDLAPGLKTRVPGQLRRGRLVTPVPPLDQPNRAARADPKGADLLPLQGCRTDPGLGRWPRGGLEALGPPRADPARRGSPFAPRSPNRRASRSAPAESTAGG